MLCAYGLKIKMQVLSLFDGMSCGQLALCQLGIPIAKYYASEIDKYAIAVTQANFPNTIQVGDVCALDPKDFADVDLIIGGSPCVGFSVAGKGKGFQDPRSALFFEFVRLVKAIQPKYFLLENVRMKKEWLAIISEQLGVEGICINSALVSAQNRVRYYWTNIPNVTQPADQGIFLKDILEIDAEEPMYSNIYGGFGEKKPRTHFSKSVTIRANSGGGAIPSISKKPVHNKINQAKVDNMEPGDIAATQINNSKNFGNAVNVDGKAFTLRASNPNGVIAKEKNQETENELHYRKLLPIECMRLQTVPDDYKMPVSNTQKYKLLGNGFTVAVIQHIFSHMEAT